MNKDEIAGLVKRLMSKVFGNLTPGAIDHADLDGMAFLVEDAADALTTLSAENERLRAAAWRVLAYDQLLRKVGEIRAEALLAGDMPNVDAAYDDMVKTCVNALSGKTGGGNG